MCCRIAIAGPKRRTRAGKGPESFVSKISQQRYQNSEESVFLKNAVWHSVIVKADDPAGWWCRARPDAGHFKCHGIRHAKMSRLVHDDNRHISGYFVEFISGRRALFGQLAFVIPKSDDQVYVFYDGLIVCDPVRERSLYRGNISVGAVRRCQQIGRKRLQPTQNRMPVAVDKARQHRATV